MFSLTREERQVILFLISVALFGAGIDFLAKKCSTIKTITCFSQEIGKINLNKADKDLLMSIPGIGEKLAMRIIEYREKRTGFSAPEELKNIKGISASKYEKIKNYLIVK